jgi:hypothetical protein
LGGNPHRSITRVADGYWSDATFAREHVLPKQIDAHTKWGCHTKASHHHPQIIGVDTFDRRVESRVKCDTTQP